MEAGRAAVPAAPAPASGSHSPLNSPRRHFAPFGAPPRALYVGASTAGSPRQTSNFVRAPLAQTSFSPRVLVAPGLRSPRAQISPFASSPRAPAPAPPPARAPPPPQQDPPAQASNMPPTRNTRRNNRKQNHQNQDVADNCKVHVTGFPAYTQPQDLLRVFAQFGAVRINWFSPKFAYLAYSAPEEAAAAMRATKKVNIYGDFLTVKRYDRSHAAEHKHPKKVPIDMFPMSKQKGVIVEPKEIELSGSFEQQLQRVLGTVRLTQEEAAKIGQLYADLEQVLQPHWPGCVAMPFGSITTGLGIKTSDADCFVHIPDQFQNANVGANFVQRAKRILSTYNLLFTEILSIPRANTPIVKFFHIPTQTNCDLSFKTLLGAQNSKLISFLLRADPRLIPMAVLIKYWAKVHGFSGTGKLTNYALTMMIIFYLQQPPISILPSVESLQRDRANDVIIDYWNTGFMDHNQLPPSTNTSSISELLGGFFEYYANFNFQEMVICPYLGTPIKREVFDDLRKLPDEFQRYKYNVRNALVMPLRFTTPICVEDPYEQSHNVASAITSKLASEIDAYFKFAAEAYSKEKLNNCKEFLKIILLKKPKIVTIKSHPEFRVNLFPKHIHNIVDPNWKSVVRPILFTIFEKMLKLTLVKAGEKTSPAGKEKERYTTTLTKAIWKRKQFNRLYSVVNIDFQQKQEKITEEILRVEKLVFDVQMQVTMVYASDTNSAAITVKLSQGPSEHFKEFGKFFVTVMLNWFLVMVKPFTKPSAINSAVRLQESILNGQPEPNANLDSDDDESSFEAIENAKKAYSSKNLPNSSGTLPKSGDDRATSSDSDGPNSDNNGLEGNDDRPDCSDNEPNCSDSVPKCIENGLDSSDTVPNCDSDTDKGATKAHGNNSDVNIDASNSVVTGDT